MGIAKDIKKFLSVVFALLSSLLHSRNLYVTRVKYRTPPADTGESHGTCS